MEQENEFCSSSSDGGSDVQVISLRSSRSRSRSRRDDDGRRGVEQRKMPACLSA